MFAYLVRFLALALNTVEAGLGKINRNLDDAARILGRGPGGALVRVHVPLMWGSVLTAVILVFVDVLKELPATLILRPFNFETLAVRVYRFAADERLAEASTAALAIVVVGLIPVILLSRAIARARPHGPPAYRASGASRRSAAGRFGQAAHAQRQGQPAGGERPAERTGRLAGPRPAAARHHQGAAVAEGRSDVAASAAPRSARGSAARRR